MNHIFYLMEDITESSVKEFTEFINTVNNGDCVHIQSFSHGGLVYAGLAIQQVMDLAKARGVSFIAYVYGLSASASAIISLNCNCLYMADGAQILIHSAYGGTDEGIKIANEEQLKIIHKKLPDYKLSELDADNWISSREAIEIGLADGLITNNNNIKLAAYFNKNFSDSNSTLVKGDFTMEEIKKDVIEEVKEEKQDEELAADENKSAEDILEAIVERLDEIEHRLAVLEGEGKKQDDEALAECGEDERKESARLNALYARIMKPCASKPKTIDTVNTKAEQEKELADFNKRINITDYIR